MQRGTNLGERDDRERELLGPGEYAQSIVETVREPLLVLESDLRVKSANAAFFEHFRVDPEETIGRKVYDLGNGQWDIPALRELLEDVLPDSNVFNDYEVRHDFEDLGERIMLLNGRRLRHAQLILLGIRDITDQRQREEELAAAKEYAESIVETVREPLLVLESDLRVKSANAAFFEHFRVNPEETIGRKVYDLGNGQWDIPALRELLEDVLPDSNVFNDYEVRHDFEDLGERIMLLNGRRLRHAQLILLGIRDVTGPKRREKELTEAKIYAESIVETMHEPLLVLHSDLRVKSVNPAFYEQFRVRPEETIGRRIYDLGNGQWDIPVLRELLEDVLPDSNVFNDYEVSHEFENIGARVMLLNARRLDHVQLILLGVRDITERKRAEQRLEMALDATQLGVFEWDLASNCLTGNERFCEWFGVGSERSTTVAGLLDRVHPEDLGFVDAQLREAKAPASSGRFNFEFRLAEPGADGDRWLLATGQFSFEGEGAERKPVRALGTSLDITSRKRGEQALRGSEQLLRLAQEAARIGAFEWDIRRNISRWSGEMEDLHGLERGSYGGSYEAWAELVHPDDVAVTEEAVRSALRTGVLESVWRIVRPDGSVRWVEARGRVDYDGSGEPVRVIGVNVDVTERVAAEEALRESEARFHAVFQKAATGIAIADLQGRVQRCNSALLQTLGYGRSELLGLDLHTLMHPDDVEASRLGIKEIVRGDAPSFEIEAQYVHRSGRIVWAHKSVSLLRDAEGEPSHLVVLFSDVTERRRTLQALRESEERLRLAAEATGFGTYDYDVQRGVSWWSRQLCEIAGLHPTGDQTEIAQEAAIEIVHPDDLERYRQTVREALDPLGPRRHDITFRIVRPDGNERWVRDVGRSSISEPPDGGRATRVIGTVQDVTGQQEAERVLRRSREELEQKVVERTQELRAHTRRLRELARELRATEGRERKRLAQLLHDDLQQYLVALKMRLGSAARSGDPEAALRTVIDGVPLVEEAIRASRDLTRELRPPVLYEDGLGPALRWLAEDMQSRHGLHVGIEGETMCDTSNEDLRVLIFECVRELLLNVVKHAEAEHAQIACEQSDGELSIEVIDSGRGFDPEAVERRKREGGGLGLFSIRERLESVAGRLRVASAPGGGARVTLLVPLSEPAGAEPRPEPRAPSRPVPERGTARVLVVDDHAMMRQGLVTLISGSSEVEVVGEAANGAEALEAVERLEPDVVLLDVNMPRMNGIETAREISRRWPWMRVVGLSVQDDSATRDSMLAAGASAFISKSDDAETMMRAVIGPRKE